VDLYWRNKFDIQIEKQILLTTNEFLYLE